jgi:hypothetical protein
MGTLIIPFGDRAVGIVLLGIEAPLAYEVELTVATPARRTPSALLAVNETLNQTHVPSPLAMFRV